MQKIFLFDRLNKAKIAPFQTLVLLPRNCSLGEVRYSWTINRHFQISSEISVVCVHGKQAVSRSRYID